MHKGIQTGINILKSQRKKGFDSSSPNLTVLIPGSSSQISSDPDLAIVPEPLEQDMTDKDFDLDRYKERIRDLESQVQNLTEEVEQLTYFESAGLQKAKDEADRLHKTTITLEAEISRLEKLNERLSSKLSEFKAKRKNTTTFGVMTEIPHPISLDNDGPCHASEVPNEFTRTTLQGHSSRDVLVFNGNGLDFEEHSTIPTIVPSLSHNPLTVTEGHDNDSMARSYPNDKQNQTTASSIIDGEGGDVSLISESYALLADS
ncbi:hypothetical protein C8R42DRAFT_726361 [Lentinula raphanica]|nr:hypothetical protein C8R42DRAFT_726361 [Lentinula raphanica]